MKLGPSLLTLALIGCGGDGGSCPEYVQIVGGDFTRTGTTLTWTMEVAGIPETLTFDREGVPANIAEYDWEINVDADGDSATDLELSIVHYRRTDAPETITGDILSVTQEGLWEVFGAGASLAGSIDASLAGTTFTFTVDESEHAALATVTDASQSTWTTFHRYGPSITDQCEDSFQP